MVVFNGYYIGRHSGGYDPFSFDLTDFALPGGPNVLLVRVDATLSDGWFYEGAGIYRHVWLVKTAPVHVKKWGTLATAKVQPGQATVPSGPRSRTTSKGAAERPRHLDHSRPRRQGSRQDGQHAAAIPVVGRAHL